MRGGVVVARDDWRFSGSSAAVSRTGRWSTISSWLGLLRRSKLRGQALAAWSSGGGATLPQPQRAECLAAPRCGPTGVGPPNSRRGRYSNGSPVSHLRMGRSVALSKNRPRILRPRSSIVARAASAHEDKATLPKRYALDSSDLSRTIPWPGWSTPTPFSWGATPARSSRPRTAKSERCWRRTMRDRLQNACTTIAKISSSVFRVSC